MHAELRKSFTVHEIDSDASDQNPFEEYVEKVWKDFDDKGNDSIPKSKAAGIIKQYLQDKESTDVFDCDFFEKIFKKGKNAEEK